MWASRTLSTVSASLNVTKPNPLRENEKEREEGGRGEGTWLSVYKIKVLCVHSSMLYCGGLHRPSSG